MVARISDWITEIFGTSYKIWNKGIESSTTSQYMYLLSLFPWYQLLSWYDRLSDPTSNISDNYKPISDTSDPDSNNSSFYVLPLKPYCRKTTINDLLLGSKQNNAGYSCFALFLQSINNLGLTETVDN